jgi:hypothetical protein
MCIESRLHGIGLELSLVAGTTTSRRVDLPAGAGVERARACGFARAWEAGNGTGT